MLVKYSPQRNDNKLKYQFDGEIITATLISSLDEMTDTFDFFSLPEGEIDRDDEGNLLIETTLPICPILSGRRRADGVLEIELLYFHGPDATPEERFPDWQEVG